jgi:hypothetical protein
MYVVPFLSFRGRGRRVLKLCWALRKLKFLAKWLPLWLREPAIIHGKERERKRADDHAKKPVLGQYLGVFIYRENQPKECTLPGRRSMRREQKAKAELHT